MSYHVLFVPPISDMAKFRDDLLNELKSQSLSQSLSSESSDDVSDVAVNDLDLALATSRLKNAERDSDDSDELFDDAFPGKKKNTK